MAPDRPRDTPSTIREAAYQLFLQQGYHGTSMREIGQAAGLQPSSIYNHFESKEAVFVEVLRERMPQRALIAALAAARGDTADELVQDALRRMDEAMRDQYDNLRLLFIELLEFQGTHAQAVIQEFLPQFAHFMQNLLGREAVVRPLPPPMIVRAFLGLFMSYAITVAFFRDVMGIRPNPRDLEVLGDIFLRGILVRTPEEAQERSRYL